MLLDQILFYVPCPIFWKDLNGAFLGCNKLFLEAVAGFQDYNQLIGTYDSDLPWRGYKDEYEKDDQNVIATGETITRIENIQLHGRTIISETIKTPLIQDGKIIGVLGICLDVTARMEKERLLIEKQAHEIEKEQQEKFKKFIDDILHIIQNYKIDVLNEKLGNNSYKKDTYSQQIILTKREREILYFLSLNKSPKEIAKILAILENKNVSASTIQSIIDKQLYPKFDTFSISKLIEKANFLKLIPFMPDILNKMANT